MLDPDATSKGRSEPPRAEMRRAVDAQGSRVLMEARAGTEKLVLDSGEELAPEEPGPGKTAAQHESLRQAAALTPRMCWMTYTPKTSFLLLPVLCFCPQTLLLSRTSYRCALEA